MTQFPTFTIDGVTLRRVFAVCVELGATAVTGPLYAPLVEAL